MQHEEVFHLLKSIIQFSKKMFPWLQFSVFRTVLSNPADKEGLAYLALAIDSSNTRPDITQDSDTKEEIYGQFGFLIGWIIENSEI